MPDRKTPLRRRMSSAFAAAALLGACGPSAVFSPSAALPKRAAVLSGDSVDSVRFGASQATAVTALRRRIGATEGGVRSEKGNCTIDAALYWANFSVYFHRARFVGYQTGNNVSDKREPVFNGMTPKGLRVGDTLAEARRLYPGRVTTSGVNGGVYAIKTSTGTIRGYLSSETSSRSDRVKISSISAGSVGCPAASPG